MQLRTLALAVASCAAASSSAQSGFPFGQAGSVDPEPFCQAPVSRSAYPNFLVESGDVRIGYLAATDYDVDDQLVPEPVPISLVVRDPDTVMYDCIDECVAVEIESDTTVSWRVVTPNGGGFVHPDGSLVQQLDGRQAVLWQPPMDLGCGEERSIVLRATVSDDDTLDDQRDPHEGTQDFDAVVRRGGDSPSYFQVEVHKGTVTEGEPQTEEPECDSGGGCCIFAGGAPGSGSGIGGGFAGSPTHLLTRRPRTLTVLATDLDDLSMECGVPPCPSVFGTGPFESSLDYSWSIVQGTGTLYVLGGDTVIFEGTQAGKVKIKVEVTDHSGPQDPPLVLEHELWVHEAGFVDQDHVAVAPLPVDHLGETTDGDEGLSFSRIGPSGETMNACGGNYTPTFDGPPITFAGQSVEDPHTYRVELRQPDAESGWDYRIELEVVQPNGVVEYDESFQTITGPGARWRSRLHVKLVTNRKPTTDTLYPHALYDDEACGRQTALAHLGDWFRARVFLEQTGQPEAEIGRFALPVGRPWAEQEDLAALTQNAALPIATGELAFVVSGASAHYPALDAAAHHSDRSSWDQATSVIVERASEDHAQGAIGFERKAPPTIAPPLQNAVRLKNLGPITAGTISVDVEGFGTITSQTQAGDSFSQAVERLRSDLEQAVSEPCVAKHNSLQINDSFLVVVGRGATMKVTDAQENGTGMTVEVLLQNWGADVVSAETLNAFAMGTRGDLEGSHVWCDLQIVEGEFVVLNGFKAVHTEGDDNPLFSFTGLDETISTTDRHGWGSDAIIAQPGVNAGNPMLFGHELGHFLGNPDKTTSGLQRDLMVIRQLFVEYPIAGADNPNPDDVQGKRLDWNEIAVERADTTFLDPVCVTLPSLDD